MPKMKPEQYTSQKETLLQLAARPEGVTISDIMTLVKNGDKPISRPRAEKLIKENNLTVIQKSGRIQVFGTPGREPLPENKTRPRSESINSRITKLSNQMNALSDELLSIQNSLNEIKSEVASEDSTSNAPVIEVLPSEVSASN